MHANDNISEDYTATREGYMSLIMASLANAFDYMPESEANKLCQDVVSHALSISKVKIKFSIIIGGEDA